VTRTVKPGRDRGLPHAECERSFAIREPRHVDRDERVAKAVGGAEIATFTFGALTLDSGWTACRSSNEVEAVR
jgi:hypothetical protein